MKFLLDLELSSSPLSVRKVAALAREALSDVPSLKTLHGFELALVEGCTNAVRHGESDDDEVTFRVRLSFDGQELRAVIENRGAPFDFDGKRRPVFDPERKETFPTGGMGICLMRDLMTAVHYEAVDGMNRVTLIKDLREGRPMSTSAAADDGDKSVTFETGHSGSARGEDCPE